MSLIEKESVTAIMTRQPLSVNLDHTLMQAYDLMVHHAIRHLPVVDGNKLIGILSKVDLDRISLFDQVEKNHGNIRFNPGFSIEQVMTKNVHTIQAEDSIKEAAEMLSFGNYHAIPVLKDNDLVGIVTTTDVINFLLETY